MDLKLRFAIHFDYVAQHFSDLMKFVGQFLIVLPSFNMVPEYYLNNKLDRKSHYICSLQTFLRLTFNGKMF